MDFLKNIYSKAARSNSRVILANGADPRTLIAAEKIKLAKIARPILLGHKENLEEISYDNGCNISGIEIIDPGKENQILYASLLVKQAQADALVCGTANPKPEIISSLEPVLPKIKNLAGGLVGIAIVLTNNPEVGEEGLLFFADCCVHLDPGAEELAQICRAAAQLFIDLLCSEPRLALLSHSTKSNLGDPSALKISQALEIVKREKPELLIDGNLQADTALLPRAVSKKDPENPLEGYANVLIFPDIDSANIGLNLTHIFGQAVILGPVIYGLENPVICVSRSCVSDDLVNAAALASALVEPKESAELLELGS